MSQVLEWVCFYYIQCAGCTLSIQRTLGDKMKDESARKKHKNKWCTRWNTGKSMKFILKKNRSIILLDEKCWCVHTHIIGTQYYMYLSHIHSMNVDQLNWSFFFIISLFLVLQWNHPLQKWHFLAFTKEWKWTDGQCMSSVLLQFIIDPCQQYINIHTIGRLGDVF